MFSIAQTLKQENKTPNGGASSTSRTGTLQRCACGKKSSGPEGECPECKKKREAGAKLQRKGARPTCHSESSATAPPIVHDVLRSSGQPLDTAARAFMEPRFGYDFSRVRVHTDSQAAKSAEAVNAQAYTVGSNVVFGAGRGPSHQQLLAHELAHVVQQGGRQSGGSLQVAPANDSAERAADRAADQVLSGAHPANSMKAEGRLQRLGANPGCDKAQADAIHQGIYDANPWAKKAIKALEARPLAQKTLDALKHNFAAEGTEANAPTIATNLEAGRADMFKNPYSCTNPTNDTACKDGNCGDSAPGSHASNICVATTQAADAYFKGGCVLHEAMHASNASMDVDSYSGWLGHAAKGTAGYPGTAPLKNADSYTTLAIELS